MPDLHPPAADLVGTWRLASAVQGGRDVTGQCDARVAFRWDGSALRMQSVGGTLEGVCHFDPAADPPRMDLTYIWDGNTLTTLGVYQLAGERLTVCRGGCDRPDSLDGTVPDGRILFVYERET